MRRRSLVERARERRAAVAGARPLRPVILFALAGLAASCGGSTHETTTTQTVSVLSVRPCKTENGLGPATPAVPGYLPRNITTPSYVTADQADELVLYEGDIRTQPGLRLLAPRGWTCSAGIGANGSWGIDVVSVGGQSARVYGEYNGPGATTACAYFQAAEAAAPFPENCVAPKGTTMTVLGPHLVTLKAPAKGGLTTLSFMTFHADQQNQVESASCTMAGAQRSLCEPILREARGRLH
jgi:hypothetical protein